MLLLLLLLLLLLFCSYFSYKISIKAYFMAALTAFAQLGYTREVSNGEQANGLS